MEIRNQTLWCRVRYLASHIIGYIMLFNNEHNEHNQKLKVLQKPYQRAVLSFLYIYSTSNSSLVINVDLLKTMSTFLPLLNTFLCSLSSFVHYVIITQTTTDWGIQQFRKAGIFIIFISTDVSNKRMAEWLKHMTSSERRVKISISYGILVHGLPNISFLLVYI